jgi:hypothetical protein
MSWTGATIDLPSKPFPLHLKEALLEEAASMQNGKENVVLRDLLHHM